MNNSQVFSVGILDSDLGWLSVESSGTNAGTHIFPHLLPVNARRQENSLLQYLPFCRHGCVTSFIAPKFEHPL